MIVQVFPFWETPHLLHSVCTSLCPSQQCIRVLLSTHPHQHLLLLVFLKIVILTEVQWNLKLVLIRLSLKLKHNEHILRHLFLAYFLLFRHLCSGTFFLSLFIFSLFSFQSAFISEKVLRDRIVLCSPFYTWDDCASASWCWNYSCSTLTIPEDWFARKFNFADKTTGNSKPLAMYFFFNFLFIF